jgi:CO/xanthine dehydrogenase Mo-binding subunit/CO/xanthine dehydrogenase FAD-binding subunit
MKAFAFQRVTDAEDAVRALAARSGSMFLAGGTTLVDLMKVDVLTPDTIVGVRPLGLSSIDVSDEAITVGANVTNSHLAWHPVVRDRYPVLSEAILSGATTQIRNMATVAGNILQRTRCSYFRDIHALCNRRQPGSGCDALNGFNRGHAVLGVSEHCIATHPSDMCVAMAVLDADVHTVRPDGTKRSLPFGEFHHAPGDTPHVEVSLEHGELITHIVIPHLPAARRSHGVRDSLAAAFGVDPADVRVLVPFVGGAFGAGLRVWPHTILAALAARVTKRPVKLVLTRAQMFTSIGHRPNTIQQLSLGATRDGQLTAIEHISTSSIGMSDELFYPITNGTTDGYACPNVTTRATQIRQSVPTPGWMRAPGEAEGSFALESAIDELSYALGIDPIELRVKNHAHVHPESGLPWSSNALLECYRKGAERFGWSARNPKPRSMRNGRQLVGYGMARAALIAFQPACKAIASIRRDGTAFVRSGATDIGPGPYTVMTMLAADCLGAPIERVQFSLGDSAMPKAPAEGGSGLTGALGNAVQAACVDLVRAFVGRVTADASSPLKGCRMEDITVRDGGIQITDDPARFETYAEILARHGLDEITVEGESAPPGETSSTAMVARAGRFVPFTAPSTGARAHAGAYAAHFVEVHVDPDLGTVRVARVVSAVDGGRILNPKTARSQIIGGIAGGIGMALLEETVSDRTGRLATTSLAEYVVAANADVRDVEVLFVGQPDSMSPLGTKGVGELAIAGMGAAIANAVYHATGTRVRSLPISIEKVLGNEA